MSEPVIETCDMGHMFAKLPDHPKNSMGHAACPHCLVEGKIRLTHDKQLMLKAILEHIEKGVDELTVRRIWESALISGRCYPSNESI